MKKLFATLGVVVTFSGCSGNVTINTNPDENFDENYQGSSNIELENAGKIEKENEEPIDETPLNEEETGGEIVSKNGSTDEDSQETVEDIINEEILPDSVENVNDDTAINEGTSLETEESTETVNSDDEMLIEEEIIDENTATGTGTAEVQG